MVVCTLLLSSLSSWAAPDGAPDPAPEPTPVETPAREAPAAEVEPVQAEAAPEPEPIPAKAAEPEPAPEPTIEPVDAVAPPDPSPRAEAPREAKDEPPGEPKWYDAISLGAFADAYASVNFYLPSPQTGGNALRAFDANNGFSLAWAGVDAAYEGNKVGATVALRFGTGPNAGWQDDAVPGIQHVKQAYATWKPTGRLSIDFGRFDTIYGAEVAESWQNHTYTRGFLYNLAQPFWHTGFRANVQLVDAVGLNLLAVNGWGHIVDNNPGKTFGAQLAITPGKGVVGLYLGYLGGPESPEIDEATGDKVGGVNRRWRHLGDAVLTVDWKKLSVAVNADYAFDDAPAVYGGVSQWYGGMASLHYQFVKWFGTAVRGEFLGDPDGFMSGTVDTLLTTGTVTLDFKPVEHLTIRVDGRYDGSNNDLFPQGFDTRGQHQITATLGMVVSSF